jgi:hypothetical protein
MGYCSKRGCTQLATYYMVEEYTTNKNEKNRRTFELCDACYAEIFPEISVAKLNAVVKGDYEHGRRPKRVSKRR